MKMNRFDSYMAAVTFAEAGEHESAREMLEAGKNSNQAPAPGTGKPYLKTAVFGGISLAAYVALFANQRWVMDHFTVGGWATLLPVGTAFFFSFVHGAFASNLLSVLNLEAKK